jgi:hypothetical protein
MTFFNVRAQVCPNCEGFALCVDCAGAAEPRAALPP